MTKMQIKKAIKVEVEIKNMVADVQKALKVEQKAIDDSQAVFDKAKVEALDVIIKLKQEKDSGFVLTQKISDALAPIVVAKVLSTTKGLNPLFVFEERLKLANNAFVKTDGEEKDVAAFKRAFHLAQAECVNRYKAEGNSTAVDYLKAAGLIFLGVLVAIIASPVLLFSADKRQDLGNFFFSGVDTDRSKFAQDQMKADAADSLLETAPAAK